MFGMIKNRIIEFMDEPMQALRVEQATNQFGVHTLTFKDFRACGALEIFERKDPITSIPWTAYVQCAFQTSFYPEESKIIFDACLLRDGSCYYWEEVGDALGAEVIDAMTWEIFFTRFILDL